jgi:hypothetical protein
MKIFDHLPLHACRRLVDWVFIPVDDNHAHVGVMTLHNAADAKPFKTSPAFLVTRSDGYPKKHSECLRLLGPGACEVVIDFYDTALAHGDIRPDSAFLRDWWNL